MAPKERARAVLDEREVAGNSKRGGLLKRHVLRNREAQFAQRPRRGIGDGERKPTSAADDETVSVQVDCAGIRGIERRPSHIRHVRAERDVGGGFGDGVGNRVAVAVIARPVAGVGEISVARRTRPCSCGDGGLFHAGESAGRGRPELLHHRVIKANDAVGIALCRHEVVRKRAFARPELEVVEVASCQVADSRESGGARCVRRGTGVASEKNKYASWGKVN